MLTRIYKIIDNREFFLNWLRDTGLYFADGKTEDGTPNYLDWWDRIRNVKVGGIKAEEKLLRNYESEMNDKIVKRQSICKMATLAVYEDRLGTSYCEDNLHFLSTLNDNHAHGMDALLITDSRGNLVTELKSELLKDYGVLKAKSAMRHKNRKKDRAAKK